jgi:small subunit ribosomal protein S25e
MPGKKSLAKQEKQQAEKTVKKSSERKEKIIGSIQVPDLKSSEIRETLQKMKAITPNAVASQFNIKVSVAKKMLNEMENNGILKMVARSSNLKVYAFN